MILAKGLRASRGSILLASNLLEERMSSIFEPQAERFFAQQIRHIGLDYAAHGDLTRVNNIIRADAPELHSMLMAQYARTQEAVWLQFESEYKKDSAILLLEFKKAPDKFLAGMRDYLEKNGAREVTKINETSREKIKIAIMSGIDSGQTRTEISKNILDLGGLQQIGYMSPAYRSRNVSRTETHFASQASRYHVGPALGIETGTEWISNDDKRTRKWHFSMDGKRAWHGIPFTVPDPKVGTIKMLHPGDPSAPPHQVCQCRCGSGIVFPEDMPESLPAVGGNYTPTDIPSASDVLSLLATPAKNPKIISAVGSSEIIPTT